MCLIQFTYVSSDEIKFIDYKARESSLNNFEFVAQNKYSHPINRTPA